MRITAALAVPVVVAFASLLTGAVAAPPTHIGQVRADAESLVAGPIDGGGPFDLSLPSDLPVGSADASSPGPSLGPPLGSGAVGGVDGGAPEATGGVTVTPAVSVTGSASGVPSNVLAAYQRAAQTIAGNDPACHLPWPVLAGIGKVESGHARGGALDSSGRTLSPILGPALSGGPGLATIPDSDDGRWDSDTVWDRAVGPMQFIPSSWRSHAADGNGDGNADPSNIYDATLAAAGYLCTSERDLSRESDLRQAVFGYNHSQVYVDTVLAWARAYASGGAIAITPASGDGGTVVLASGQGNGGVSSADRRPKRPGPKASASPTTASASVTPTPRPAPSATVSAEPRDTSAPPPTGTETATSTPTGSPSPTETGCPTPTPTGTETPTDSPTPTESPTPTPTPTPTGTDTPTGSPSPTPTDPCATPTPSPTASSSETPTETPSETPTPTPTPTP